MKKLKSKYFPEYVYIPLIFVVLMNFTIYYGSILLTNSFFHHSIGIIIDEFIPFFPFFVLFYLLAYLQWIVGFIVISCESRDYCYKYLSAEIIAKFLCLICFVLFPTTMIRPEITGTSFWDSLTKFVYRFDAPVNLFPSIHCLESWICFRGSLKLKKVPNSYKYVMFFFSILVFLSTVFVKQHVFLDIIGGVLVVEIGIWISNHFSIGIIFQIIHCKMKQVLKKVL